MFLTAFKTTGLAVMQICLLGAIGYFLMKKDILNETGLDILSRLVVEVTLPALIFSQLIKDFSFSLYPDWWIFPLLSIAITIIGLLAGYIFTGFIHDHQHKMQFLSLITFQNAGYLPLALIAALLPQQKSTPMLIYLFLFLLGFNLVLWSFGVHMLSLHENKRFELWSLFSPPVIAILSSLAIIFFGLNRYIPQLVLKPLKMAGECTVPLALFVVGGSLAAFRIQHIDKKAVFLIVLVKLIILPLLGLVLVLKLKIPELIGLLIIMQLAVPPATSLSVITRHYKKEDLIISHGIFFGHIISLITLPLFLSLYLTLVKI